MKDTPSDNRYHILKTLGEGGYSQTFLATDTNLSSTKRCVIKQLKSITHLQKQQWMKRQFKNEADILERLGAENNQIPQLYAYFSEGNTFYLIQEWIEGITLTQKQQIQGVLSEREIRKILVSLLSVLDYIHSQNIIHQDIKPDNIILRAIDELPVLIDFGAAIEATTTKDNNQNNDIVMMGTGTPGYMSSEQITGHPVFASDLYSLGLTAIYLLTGKTPQDFDTNWDTGEIMWHREARNISINLIMVIDKAIRSHVSDRFSSAREMLAALESQSLALTHTPKLLSGDIKETNHFPNNITPKILSLFLLFGVGIGLITVTIESISLEPVSKHSSTKTFSSESPETLIAPPFSLSSPALEFSPVPSSVAKDNSKNLTDIPIFVLGTVEEQILTVLGEPTWRRKGYWANSMAWLYEDILPNQADIGYLFDIQTKELRQTEISFAPSVNLETMQNTLNQMLSNNLSPVAKEGLEQIYNRQINRQKFRVANLEGIIQRNDKDRIYIAIWETGFHK